jgi:hypothetical protein
VKLAPKTVAEIQAELAAAQAELEAQSAPVATVAQVDEEAIVARLLDAVAPFPPKLALGILRGFAGLAQAIPAGTIAETLYRRAHDRYVALDAEQAR